MPLLRGEGGVSGITINGLDTDTLLRMKSTPLLNHLSTELATNKGLQKEAAQKLDSNVIFEVTDKAGDHEWWGLDAKKGDTVGLTKLNEKSPGDISIRIDDLNLRKLIRGKQTAQRLYMSGKLKIKGNVMKAAYIEKLLKFAAPEKAKL